MLLWASAIMSSGQSPRGAAPFTPTCGESFNLHHSLQKAFDAATSDTCRVLKDSVQFIEKSIHPLFSCRSGIEVEPWHAGRRAAVGIGNRIWGNETVMTFLKTGVFNYWVPLGGVIHWEVLHSCLFDSLGSFANHILPDFDRAMDLHRAYGFEAGLRGNVLL